MAGALSRRTRVVLTVSLVLNVFALGAVASALVFDGQRWFGGREQPQRFVGMPSPRHLRTMLHEADHAKLRDAMEARRPEIRARIGKLRDARRDVAAAMRAEPFDRVRLEAALTGLRESEGATAAEIHAMIADLIARLDAPARARVAESIQARPRRAR